MSKKLAVTLAAAALGCSLTVQANSAATRHPMVLVPGIFAFDTIAGIDYWYKIPSTLSQQGGKVYVPRINAFDSSVKRGEALIAQLEEIRAASAGKVQKFNQIGRAHV